MQLLAAAGGAVVCLGPVALATKAAVAEFGTCVYLTSGAWAATTAQDWMDTLRYSVKLGMGNNGYIPLPETELWDIHSKLDYDRVTLRQKGRLMSKEEKHNWWLKHTPEGWEYSYNKIGEA